MEGILYSGWLEEDSKHSIRRAKQRMGLNRKRAQKMMDLARHRSLRGEDCKWSLDRKFLEEKSSEKTEAVAYNGYCFILDRDTMHCITVIPLPKCFGKKKTFYTENQRKSISSRILKKY